MASAAGDKEDGSLAPPGSGGLQQDLPPEGGNANFIMQPFASGRKSGSVAHQQDQSPRKVPTSPNGSAPRSKQGQAVDSVRKEVLKLAEYQKIVERDDRLGVPEA